MTKVLDPYLNNRKSFHSESPLEAQTLFHCDERCTPAIIFPMIFLSYSLSPAPSTEVWPEQSVQCELRPLSWGSVWRREKQFPNTLLQLCCKGWICHLWNLNEELKYFIICLTARMLCVFSHPSTQLKNFWNLFTNRSYASRSCHNDCGLHKCFLIEIC